MTARGTGENEGRQSQTREPNLGRFLSHWASQNRHWQLSLAFAGNCCPSGNSLSSSPNRLPISECAPRRRAVIHSNFLARHRRAVAVVEFAFLLPLILILL